VIYITAGLSNRTICNKAPKDCLKVNYLQQKKIILDCLGLNPSIKIVVLSSSTVYPEITYNTKISESQGIKYFDCYSKSKFLIEGFINNLDENFRQRIKIIRPFFIYGPGKHTDLIGSWLYKIKNSGLNAKLHVGNLKLIRDFLFIDDCVDALIKISETESNYNTYNICSGQPTLLNDLLNMILSISDFRGTVESVIDLDRGDEHIFRVGDNARLIELGWTQQVSLKEGLEKTFGSLHRSRL
jgi:nucleoside-diphosphate-sugar epimerase